MTERMSSWAWLFVGLVVGGVSFAVGRLDAQTCQYLCKDTKTECLYSGNGTIIQPTSTCYLKRWAIANGANTNCSGTTTQSVNLCVGAGSYCRAPASGEYSLLATGIGNCGSCSGTTTISCCQICM